MPNNPLAGNPDPNARRIVAYGLPQSVPDRDSAGDARRLDRRRRRGGTFEEINRVPDAGGRRAQLRMAVLRGRARAGSGFDAADLDDLREPLRPVRRDDAAVLPLPARAEGRPDRDLLDDDRLGGVRDSRSRPPNSTFPASYDNALFFADYSRRCIWVMFPDASGIPNPATVTPFVQDASYPVDLQFGPDGNLYYVDVGDGNRSTGSRTSPATSRRSQSRRARRRAARLRWWSTSTARARAIPTASIASYAWDLDGDGTVRRLDRAEPVVHVHDGGHVCRPPEGHRQPGRTGRLGSDHDHCRKQRADRGHRSARPVVHLAGGRRDRVLGPWHGPRGR